jgi:hypothetical protein
MYVVLLRLKDFEWRNLGVPGLSEFPRSRRLQTITGREAEAEPIAGMIFHLRNGNASDHGREYPRGTVAL